MTVTVMIKKKVVPENKILMEELYREMRSAALTQEGYIGAETLKRVDMEVKFFIESSFE
jgi:hypothetical protein